MFPGSKNKSNFFPNVFSVNNDISEESEKNEEIFESEEILETCFEETYPNKITTTDTDVEVICEKYYKYSALQLLNKSIPKIGNYIIAPTIHICAYQVNTKGKLPFLQYFMHKYLPSHKTKPDNITFPKFTHIQNADSLEKAYSILDVMFFCYKKNGFYEYRGYLLEDNNYYLFFDCSEYNICIHDLYRENDIWLLTIDELINTKTVCNSYQIEPLVTQMFEKNSQFIFLQDENNENYEIPTIAYIGGNNSELNFISTFGASQCNENDRLFGNYYYFTNYPAAIKGNNGAVRVALFLGNMKTVQNLPNDEPDKSKITQEMLKHDATCTTIEHRKLINYIRISDRDGTWTDTYDSLFLGDILLDNGETVGEDIVYVVKEYDQQLPLTCHFLQKPQ